eukprot:4942351-Pyramimonas_sp.AAC.1
MSPKAAKMSRLMPLGPRASYRCSEHARNCSPDAVAIVTPTMRCLRSLGAIHTLSAASGSLRTRVATPPEFASGPSLSVGAA